MSNRDFANFKDPSDTFENPQATETMREKVYDATSRLKEKASDMTRMAGEKLGETRESAANTLDKTASQVRERSTHMSNPTMSKVTSTLADGLERTSVYLRSGGTNEVRSDIEKLVKSRPAESIIGALAIGYLAGRMFKRR
jgi:ElaB/YqjD/DUF883 family membrane-anchored ribosome-binding protein